MRLKRIATSMVLLIAVALPPGAASAAPEGVWMVAEKVAVRVFECSGKLCGAIVWLRKPSLRTPEMCGRTIIWNLQPSGNANWDDGWFYDPEDDKTYNVDAQQVSPDLISARVYLGTPFFGRTETLRRVALGELDGRC
ncbi:MAG TPA: DUF2147 domain-containing protein [Acetobacteraceae bacterium]|nr:DUF2147 domain-containing protein [Acetobacteraceae bacterium]